jgi:MFS family permease
MELLSYRGPVGSRLCWLDSLPYSPSVTTLQRTKHTSTRPQQSHLCFMPVYFQAVLGSSPIQSGIKLLPTTIAVVPFGIMAGILMSKTGLYRPLHWIAMALCAIGAGLISRLDANSSKAEWICFQIIIAGGGGIIAAATLPAILAALPESDVAAASGAFSFIRSFGYVWGVTLPSIIFNNQFDKHIGQISDSVVQSQLSNGAAYGQVSGDFVNSLPMDIKPEVIGVYVDALRVVWKSFLLSPVSGSLLSLLRNTLN